MKQKQGPTGLPVPWRSMDLRQRIRPDHTADTESRIGENWSMVRYQDKGEPV